MFDEEHIRAAIRAWSSSPHDPSGFIPTRWPIDSLVAAIDAFCAKSAGDQGDRLRVNREPWDTSVSWVWSLDDTELGRVVVTPLPPAKGGYEVTEKATAIMRGTDVGGVHGVPAIERERHAIFSSIMQDLDRHLALWSGERKPGGVYRRRPVFWTEGAATESEYQEQGPPTTADQVEEVRDRPLQRDPREMIGDRALMVGHMSSGTYSVKTAQEIAEALPKAWALYCNLGERWGPGLVASAGCNSTSTTIGRYVQAWKKAGITHVEGVELW